MAATACIKCAAGRYTDLREGKSEAVCGKSVLYLKFKKYFYYVIIYYNETNLSFSSSFCMHLVLSEICVAGTFAKNKGARACDLCPAGYFSKGPQSTDHDDCKYIINFKKS